MFEEDPAPKWAAEALDVAWTRMQGFLQSIGHPDWMPTPWMQPRFPPDYPAYALEPAPNLLLPKFGCGNFGCVLPTGDPEIVLKLTHDKSEAQFALLASTMGANQPPGVVRYHSVVALPGLSSDKMEPLFLLWRDVATGVGEAIDQYPGMEDMLHDAREAAGRAFFYIDAVMNGVGQPVRRRKVEAPWASPDQFLSDLYQAFRLLDALYPDGWPERLSEGVGPLAFRGALQNIDAYRDFLSVIRAMYRGGRSEFAGGMLQWLEQEEIVIADVHYGNLGLSLEGAVVITDPGVAVQVGPKNYPAPRPQEI